MTTTQPGIGIAGMVALHIARSDWASINTYLNSKPTIGRYEVSIIREICKHQRTHGIPITNNEEQQLIDLYKGNGRPTDFAQAWLAIHRD